MPKENTLDMSKDYKKSWIRVKKQMLKRKLIVLLLLLLEQKKIQ